MIAGHDTDVRSFAKELNTDLNGRGGGKPDMVQGQVSGSREEIVNCMKNLEENIKIL